MQFISVTDVHDNWIVVHISDYQAYQAGDLTLEDLVELAVSRGDRFSFPGRDATRAAIEAENADDPAPASHNQQRR